MAVALAMVYTMEWQTLVILLCHTHPKVLKYCDTKTKNIPFVQNGKLKVLGVPIFKHIRFKCLRYQGRTKGEGWSTAN